jgi:hypothetical protein
MERSTLPLTAKKASVLATTNAALEDKPEPAGTDPATSRSTATGDLIVLVKI